MTAAAGLESGRNAIDAVSPRISLLVGNMKELVITVGTGTHLTVKTGLIKDRIVLKIV